ncbi:MAG TPA: hypothetical protein VL400_20890, partial [Polyangiaceae bacterium]|nr:hypothetical protein [Polyangiaceae bacterium]
GSTSSDGSGGAGGATATDGSTSTTSSPTSTDASTGSGADPYAAEREICINKINELRATKGLSPYTRWTDAESCVDEQATSDEMTNSPHGAWVSGTYPCNGGGQNECLGAGPSGIEGCLQQMWDEKDQAACSGCDACADAYDPSCPNCDFYGSSGQVCGHYVNMSAKYFTAAACGFSSLGGWDAINFK